MYDVSLHGKSGLGLRPEGTASVARAYLEHGLHRAPQPVRLSYWDPMFRGQRPQKLRFRQFWQWGLECFGAPEPPADVEIIEFTVGLLADVGLTDYVLKVNTIGGAESRAKVTAALTEYFTTYKDELDADSKERLETSVLRIIDSKEPRTREIAAGAPKVRELISDEDRAHFAAVTDGLDRLGIRYEIDDRKVRGLDYYTRTVFECILVDPEFTQAGDISVAGGGRYDGLVRTMGGPDVPGVGVAGGVDVLYFALKKQGVKIDESVTPDVYVLSADPDDGADRIQLATPLREAGFRVAIDYSKRSLDKQLESAVKHGAKVAVIRGTEESRGGKVIVRDLVAKEQRVTRLAAVVVEVGRHVPKHPKPRLIDEPGAAGETPYLADPKA
jgi:histidyl-tRNA synthetase